MEACSGMGHPFESEMASPAFSYLSTRVSELTNNKFVLMFMKILFTIFNTKGVKKTEEPGSVVNSILFFFSRGSAAVTGVRTLEPRFFGN